MAIAKFEKVSFELFKKEILALNIKHVEAGWAYNFTDLQLMKIWLNIKLPVRSTTGSAGYDFFCPITIDINEEYSVIPTGIRCKIDNGYVLMMFPRSGLSFKKGTTLANTVGIIDQDYYNADNEGHIMIKMKSSSALRLASGDKFVQGIFVPYGVAELEEVTNERTGGMGSTGR